MAEALGFVSGSLCAASLIPQIYKNYSSGHSDDVSTSTIVCMYVALGIGTAYGFMINHVAVYVTDLTLAGLYIVLHAVKVRNQRKNVLCSGQEGVP
jgi:uncharacterized protein with PQ loop repeat